MLLPFHHILFPTALFPLPFLFPLSQGGRFFFPHKMLGLFPFLLTVKLVLPDQTNIIFANFIPETTSW